MPITMTKNPPVLDVTISGRLQTSDYRALAPQVQADLAQGGVSALVVEMVDFHGWTPGAIWADTEFATHEFSHIARIAMIGDQRWEQGMAVFCGPFTKGAIRYADAADEQAVAAVRAWARGE